MVDYSRAVVTGATYYDIHTHSDFVRYNLALESIKFLTQRGYEVVIVDGGSTRPFLSSAYDNGARVFRQSQDGFGNGKREAIARAFETGKEIIALMDLEKLSYAKTLDVTVEAIESGSDLVIPRRKSLESYSEFQRNIEIAGNGYWKKLTDRNLDVWFGQRTFNKELAKFFLECDCESWDAIFVPVMEIIAKGYNIQSVDVDYTHDSLQVNAEHKNWDLYAKRVRQLVCLTEPLKVRWDELTKIKARKRKI